MTVFSQRHVQRAVQPALLLLVVWLGQLVVSSPTSWAGSMAAPTVLANENNATIADLVAGVSSDNIISHIDKLSQQSRCATAPERTTAISYIKNTLSQYGYNPIVQSFSTTAGGLTNTPLQNIIVRKAGSHAQAVQLLTAHFDSSPTRNFPPTCSSFAPGANDDGSGVASLLEMARVLSRYQFRDDIEIVFFDGEEFGHLGSLNFVQNWYSDKYINPNGLGVGTVVNLDMVAYPRDGRGQEIVWAVARSDNGLALAQNGLALSSQYLAGLDYRVYTIGDLFAPERDPNRLSDQQSFWNAGLGQAIFLTEDVKDIIGADPRYHTPGDKLYNQDGSLRLDPDLARQTTQVALTITGVQAGPQPRHLLGNLFAAFEQVWAGADRPVTVGVETGQNVGRGYTWGPGPNYVLTERYSEGVNGQRQVVYFDKARMELTRPDGNAPNVTNGLLVREMASGQLQLGDNLFQPRQPCQIPVAGDPNDKNQNTSAPIYSSFSALLTRGGSSAAVNTPVIATLDRIGHEGQNPALAKYTNQSQFISATRHNIPDVFWNWFRQPGRIYQPSGDYYSSGAVFDWVSTVGLPITEAYWVRTQVSNVERDVLVQLFERRVLTFTPDNPVAFQIEMGNVGQHYYNWRYGN